ncbi:MAG: acyltransferase [Thermoleophilaceae bacterium]|nr:acyltransferase [Thermoleophilaceae bacterium]
MDGKRGAAEGGRFVAGDPLRGIASMAVILFHYGLGSVLGNLGTGSYAAYDEGFGPVIGRFIMHLDIGLYVFFALSGYLLFRPMVRAFALGERQPRIGPYARNRFLRIVPVFWVVFVLTLLAYGTRDSSFWEIIAVPLFIQQYVGGEFQGTIGQAWTLDTEMQFYIFLPLFGLLLFAVLGARVKHKALFALGVLVGVFVLSMVVRVGGWTGLTYERTLPAALSLFVPGLMLAALEQWAPARLTPRAARRWSFGLLIVALLGFVWYASVPVERLFWRAVFACMISGGFVGAALVLEWARLPSPRILDNRVTQWIGSRSYPLYLLHGGIALKILLVAEDFSGVWTWFAVIAAISLPLTFLSAELLHRWVERPMMRLRATPRAAVDRRQAEAALVPGP